MIILFLYIIELVLNILKLLYNPHKSYYERDHFYNILYVQRSELNDYNKYTNKLEAILKSLEKTKKINQALLSLLSIHFIKSFIIGMVYICLYKDGQSENFLHIVLAFIMFDIFYTFINWSMSLAIISKVNEIKDDYDIIDYTNDIRICIIKVIVILSLDFVLYSIHFYCLYRKYKGDEIKIKLFQKNEPEHNNTNDPDRNIQVNNQENEIHNQNVNENNPPTRNELLSLSRINTLDYTKILEENVILKNENKRLKKLFPFEINENEKLMLLIFRLLAMNSATR